MQSYAARLFGNTFLNFVSNFSLEETNWVVYHDIRIFLKWGILNVPFYSIFVPFHLYLVMTLVVPCLDNIFMVSLISALATIGTTKPIFLDYSGSLKGEGVHACMREPGLFSLYSSYTNFK